MRPLGPEPLREDNDQEAARIAPRGHATGVLQDVQGLRAIAVLLVVVYHAGLPLPGGFVGVDMFFVISGFVITLMIKREWDRSGHFGLVRFYARRFKRLIPALALVLIVTLLLAPLLLSPLGPQEETAKTALGAVLLVANVVIARTSGDYFGTPAESNALLHTWSLSLEEQFYLVFPFLLLVALKWMERNRFLPQIVVGAVLAGSLTLAVSGDGLIDWPVPESFVGFYGPATRAWEFAIGSLIALTGARHDRRRRREWLFALGLLAMASSALFLSSHTPFPGLWTLLPVLGTGLLIVAGSPSSLLASRPLVWLGDRSYSIYLWHWPLIVFAAAVFPHSRAAVMCAAVFSLVPAVLSFRFVEEPLRHAAVPQPRRFAGWAGLTTLSVCVVALGILWALDRDYGSERVAALRDSASNVTRGCHDELLRIADVDGCTWNAAGTGPAVYLLGDSHAKHLSEGVIAAAKITGRPAIVSTASSCPMLDFHMRGGAAPPSPEDCRDYVDGTLSFLDASPPGTVVLSGSDYYWRDSETAVGIAREDLTIEQKDKLHVAREAWQRTLRRVVAAGHEVVIVQDIARWEGDHAWEPIHCIGWEVLLGDEPCRRSMPVSVAKKNHGDVRAVLNQLAAIEGVTILDPWPIVCPGDHCYTWRDGMLNYRDSNHITNETSQGLTDLFTRPLGFPESTAAADD